MAHEERHRYRGHNVRLPDHVWNRASDRALEDGDGSVRDLVHGWMAAYAARRLDALRIADNDPAHEGVEMTLFDTDMNPIGTPTAEQTETARGADGGWIWIDEAGTPFVAIDERRDDETGEYVEPYGYRTDLTKVCVA
jgi:hypothetical protein